jgi:DNA-binding MarR family transcriptional regulator
MKQINQIISQPKYQQKLLPLKRKSKNWWTPIWNGLANDTNGKHRKAMGLSIWVYLYLLSYANRKTGIVHRKQKIIAKETGLPLRTIQRHLKRLAVQKYITLETSERPLQIQIEKWKLFNHKNFNDQ